jgi:N-acyl-D-aspartate/D-glutamate deacylase
MNARRFRGLVLWLGVMSGSYGLTALSVEERYDISIKGGTIVDGTGRQAYRGDVAIKGERIVALGKVNGEASTVIDGKGLMICPGFVDTHSHVDRGILSLPLAESYIMQGVTTALSGNCGGTPAPGKSLTFGEWMSRVEQSGTSLNIAPLVGLTTTIRELVMGADFKRPATPAEIEKMKALVEEAMKSGAFGISTGLDPGSREYASRDEIIECAKVARKWGGLYESHTRNHQNNWYAAGPESFGYGILHQPKGEVMVGRYHGLLQAIETARLADNIPLIIAHFTPAYTIPQPHSEWLQAAVAKATLEDIIDPAWKRGQRVYFNVIACPYSIGWLQPVITPLRGEARRSGSLDTPSWFKSLSQGELLEKLKTREFRERVKNEVILSGNFKFEMVHPVTDPYWMDCYQILTCKNKDYEGKTIGELARERSPDDIMAAVYDESLEVLFDILTEDPEATWGLIADKRELPGALPVFLKHHAGMPCIDGHLAPVRLEDIRKGEEKITGSEPGSKPPAIYYGLFPLYIDTYVKQRGDMTLEEAVRKATSLPAREVLGLKDRGIVARDAFADLVVFDFEAIRMAGDYINPNLPPEGIKYVLVNGKIAYRDKAHTGVRSGKLLRNRQGIS